MVRRTLAFLIFGSIACLVGFTQVAGQSMSIARMFFFVFLAVFLAAWVVVLLAGRRAVGQ